MQGRETGAPVGGARLDGEPTEQPVPGLDDVVDPVPDPRQHTDSGGSSRDDPRPTTVFWSAKVYVAFSSNHEPNASASS